MTGIKLELLGIGVILAGIAMSIPSFYTYYLGAAGLAVVAGGFSGRTSARKRRHFQEPPMGRGSFAGADRCVRPSSQAGSPGILFIKCASGHAPPL